LIDLILPLLPSLVARPQVSLRRWILGASVTAVLAGYGVLLLAYSWLADLDRREAHHQLEGRLLAEAQAGHLTMAEMAPGTVAWVAAGPPATASPRSQPPLPWYSWLPRLPGTGDGKVNGPWIHRGRSYLFSTTSLGAARPGTYLHVLHDVSLEVRQQRRNTLLLLAFAGISTLVTAALLRPVLDAGLQPLQALSDGMKQMEAESLERKRLPLAPQPQELQRIARSFNDLLERLAISWERQRDFVNGVSHELRTPITLVGGYAARLRRRGTNLDPQQRQQLELIEEEAARMGRMVTDLLDLARGDAGQLSLRLEAFPVEDAFRQLVARLQPVAGGRLALEPSPGNQGDQGRRPLVLAERERLEQCLLNLVENALKYSPAGSPVHLAWERREGGVVLHVKDRGPGVPESERSRLLERFQRGSNTADVPGSGIGLAVVSTLMQAMGGAVQIGEAAGGGADFQLLLREASPEPITVEPPASISRRQPSAPRVSGEGRS